MIALSVARLKMFSPESKVGSSPRFLFGTIIVLILYASELFNVLEARLPSVHCCADDTQLYLSFRRNDNHGEDLIYLDLDLLHSTGQDFTAAQRERAQEDFKVLFKGAPPHPPSHSHTKDSHSTGITLLFSNSAWVLLRPTELSTFKEL